MDALMIVLLTWIGLSTYYPIPSNQSEFPSIEYRTAEEVGILVSGSREKAKGRDVRAGYNTEENIIYLIHSFDPENPEDQGGLLHELVHFLQTFNNKTYPCRAEKEVEAFELTKRWFYEQDLEDPFYDPFYVLLLKISCSSMGVF